ncbi:hypothetical protein ACF0H5_002711 [Mactra antiquata]
MQLINYLCSEWFQILGGSAAQFRFKDEDDWSETDEDNVTSSLCLDLDNLAESISCIQLHQRLDIDEAIVGM